MHKWMVPVILAVGIAAASGMMVSGCAEQKAAPAPSKRQVQSDSDRFFEKVGQEERSHGTVPERKGAGESGY